MDPPGLPPGNFLPRMQTMPAEQSEDDDSGEKGIGLPNSLRGELGDDGPRRSTPRPPALIDAVPAPPEEAAGLPRWAVIFFAGTALLAASWLAVMASSTLRILGWV